MSCADRKIEEREDVKLLPKVLVDDTMPPNEIRFISYRRNADGQLEAVSVRLVNVGLPEKTADEE